MKKYTEQRFIGERALFQSEDIELSCCTFADGESPLKESRNLVIHNSLFQWKYPLWYCKDIVVEDSVWFEMARAGVWYTNDIQIKNSVIEAPKNFRRCRHLLLDHVDMPNASETLWNCSEVVMRNVTAKGDYFGMGSTDMEIQDFTLTGNYCFDGAKNLTLRNVKLLSKDAFWNCENVTVYDSFISGEYLGWNSEKVKLVNCMIESEQGMCYMQDITLENCTLVNTNLAFEYSTVDAQIVSSVDSVKNPISGKIQAKRIGEVIFDNPEMRKENTRIEVEECV